MTLHELLRSMQDINVEVHYYNNHFTRKEGSVSREVDFRPGSCLDVSLSHVSRRGQHPDINWDKCEVFYVGFTSNRSRTLRINVEASEFND